jgi:succinate-acetate transporter protein
MVYEVSTQTDAQPRVFLQPIASLSILGLFGLAGATFTVAAWMAHWFGPSSTFWMLVPLAAMFGGLSQFLAGMWAFKARDGVATAVHGMWGAFFMACGALMCVGLAGAAPARLPASMFYPELGFCFIVLAVVTWACTAAAAAENKSLVTTWAFLSGSSTLAAIALLVGNAALRIVAGYLFLICAIAAWYTATARMVNEAFGGEGWALGRSTQARQMPRITLGVGEPGEIRGQA